MCLWILLFVFFTTAALLAFSMANKRSRAANRATMSVLAPPFTILSRTLSLVRYLCNISFCLCFILSLQLNACTVQSSRVSNISRRKSYSLSNSACRFSRSIHCFSDHFLSALSSGFPILLRPTLVSVSSTRLFRRLNRSEEVTLLGGAPIVRAPHKSLRAAAVGVSCCNWKIK